MAFRERQRLTFLCLNSSLLYSALLTPAQLKQRASSPVPVNMDLVRLLCPSCFAFKCSPEAGVFCGISNIAISACAHRDS